MRPSSVNTSSWTYSFSRVSGLAEACEGEDSVAKATEKVSIFMHNMNNNILKKSFICPPKNLDLRLIVFSLRLQENILSGQNFQHL